MVVNQSEFENFRVGALKSRPFLTRRQTNHPLSATLLDPAPFIFFVSIFDHRSLEGSAKYTLLASCRPAPSNALVKIFASQEDEQFARHTPTIAG
jgi:hypothetical protein